MVAKQNNTKKSPAKSTAPKPKNEHKQDELKQAEPKQTELEQVEPEQAEPKQVEKKKTEKKKTEKKKTEEKKTEEKKVEETETNVDKNCESESVTKPEVEGTTKAKSKASTTKPKNTKSGGESKSIPKKTGAKAGTKGGAKASAKTTKKTTAKGKAPAKKKATKPKAPPKPKTESQINANGKQVRYFKFARDNDADGFHGRVCGSKPKQAANKALTSILKSSGNDKAESGKIEFTIIECTRNSKHKEYHYVGERKLLENPVQVEIQNGEKIIEYKYGNHVVKNKSK